MSNWCSLEKVLEEMMPDFLVGISSKTPSAQQIDAMGAMIGIEFPKAYKDLVSRVSAIIVEAKEDVWPPPKPFDVAPYWTFIRGFYVFGFGEDIPPFLNIEKQSTEFREAHGTELAPFMRLLGSADRFCFTRDGRMVEWCHDAPEEPQPCDTDDLYDLIVLHAEGLKANADKIKAMRIGQATDP